METFLQFIAIIAVVGGTFFSVVAVLGYIRLPDVYARLHATGMVSIFGVVLLLIASVIRTPVNWGHAVVLIFFILVAGPPTAHAIASAAHRIGLPRKAPLRDDLADDQDNNAGAPEDERIADPSHR